MDPTRPGPSPRTWLLPAAGLFLAAWLPRVIGLGTFITWDELMWVYRSVHFSQALCSGQWADTFRTGHPGVTTTWLATVGIGVQRLLWGTPTPEAWAWLLRLPALDPRDGVALQRLAPYLVAAKIPLTLVTALAVVGCWSLARRVMRPQAALLGGFLLALDPFFLGLSRVLHLDALLASFMMLALLGLAVYLHHPHQRRWLCLSALATGLAALTKTPASVLLLLGTALLLGRRGRRRQDLALWGGVAAGTYIALWPAMWVTPLGTLSGVLGKALGYATEAEETAHFFQGMSVADPGPLFYPLAWSFRTSPIVWVGLLASFLVWRRRRREEQRTWLVLMAYTLLYGVFMALGAKIFDRYLLPLFPAVDLLAAMGWMSLGEALWARRPHRPVWLGVGVVLLQALLVCPIHPYYLAWYNPLLGGLRQAAHTLPVGWGEGLEQAAAYLNAQPDAETRTVASAGVPGMAPKFRGRTLPLTPASLIEADDAVVYISDRQGGPSPVDEFMGGMSLRYVVRLQGVDYAWVYSNLTYEAPLESLAGEVRADDAVLADAPSLIATHYAGPAPAHVLRDEASEAEVAAALQRLAEGRKRLWQVRFPRATSPASEMARYELASRAYQVREEAFPLVTLVLYQLAEGGVFAPTDLQTGRGPFTFGGGLRLSRYGLADASIGWGQKLGVQLEWQAAAPLEADVTAFLHLVDGQGHLWGQVDLPLRDPLGAGTANWPVGTEVAIHYLLDPWAGIPPGQYELRAGVYRSDNQQGLPAQDAQGQAAGSYVTLHQVEVVPSPLRPTAEELGLPRPWQQELGPSLMLLAYGLSPMPVVPGTTLHLDLFWRVVSSPEEDYALSVKLGDRETRLAIPNPFYPSHRWRAGEVLRGQFDIPVPADLPGGDHPLALNLVGTDGRPLLAEPVPLGFVRVEGRVRRYEVPPIAYRLGYRLGDQIALLGYDLLEPRVRSGEPLRLTLYWQAQGPTESAYAVFVHLLGSGERVLAQEDHPPQQGAAPTTGWQPQEVIVDRYQIPTPSELPPGPFQVEVGMYDLATGVRLPVTDAQGRRLPGDRVLLMPLEGG